MFIFYNIAQNIIHQVFCTYNLGFFQHNEMIPNSYNSNFMND